MNSFPGTGLTACQRLSFGSLDDRRRSSSACSGSVSDRKSTRLNSSHLGISYAVFCLKKKKKNELSHNKFKRIYAEVCSTRSIRDRDTQRSDRFSVRELTAHGFTRV